MNTPHLGKILVVDDNTANLQLLTNLLTSQGYTVYPASDGELALEFVRSTLPELILLDIRMPGIDGFEVCRRLKVDKRTSAIPIIFISALGDEHDKVKGFQAGAVDYVTKPFQTEEVLARVRNHLHLRELTEHLEHKVAERTEELYSANAQLQRELAERKAAEAALRQSETLLNATQRLAQIGGWDWDVESQTSFWTEETYRIHGLEPKAFAPESSHVIDRSLTCYDPADRPIILAAFQRCLQQGDSYDLEFPFTSADGCRKWIRTTGTAVHEEGRIIKVVGNIMDITDRKWAEAELKKLNDELEKRVSERTAELAAANVKLLELDQLKSMFIASMSHELRTPLNSIIGYSSIMLNEWAGPLNAEQKENLAAVLRSGKHLLSLINDVIDVSIIEAGKIDSIIEEFDVHDVAIEAVETFKNDIEKKGLELIVQAPPQVFHTDRRRFLQCLLNLLSNATKFTMKGSIGVSTELSADGSMMTITVEDTGIGIGEDDLGRLFSPFVRFHKSGASVIPGTGLGLYLTQKLLREILHGDILVTSTPGVGSRFTMRVPTGV
jgi:PAS domain S-box-containing protein